MGPTRQPCAPPKAQPEPAGLPQPQASPRAREPCATATLQPGQGALAGQAGPASGATQAGARCPLASSLRGAEGHHQPDRPWQVPATREAVKWPVMERPGPSRPQPSHESTPGNRNEAAPSPQPCSLPLAPQSTGSGARSGRGTPAPPRGPELMHGGTAAPQIPSQAASSLAPAPSSGAGKIHGQGKEVPCSRGPQAAPNAGKEMLGGNKALGTRLGRPRERSREAPAGS